MIFMDSIVLRWFEFRLFLCRVLLMWALLSWFLCEGNIFGLRVWGLLSGVKVWMFGWGNAGFLCIYLLEVIVFDILFLLLSK